MTTPSPLADSCPQCHPGDYPAVLPHTVTPDGMSLLAAYFHGPCGHRWQCWWDRQASGWPQPVPIPASRPGAA